MSPAIPISAVVAGSYDKDDGGRRPAQRQARRDDLVDVLKMRQRFDALSALQHIDWDVLTTEDATMWNLQIAGLAKGVATVQERVAVVLRVRQQQNQGSNKKRGRLR